jgi:hypothetical protein
VQADRALIEFTRIHDAMDGIGGIDGTRMKDIDLDGVGGFEAAMTTLQILMNQMKVFYLKAADGGGHPAILVAMVVHGTGLADFPANGHQFIEWRAVNEVAGVVLTVPIEIGCERVGADGSVLEKAANGFGGAEGGFGHLTQAFDKCSDGNSFNGGWQRCTPVKKYSARADPLLFTLGLRAGIRQFFGLALRHHGIDCSLATAQISRQLGTQQPQACGHGGQPSD